MTGGHEDRRRNIFGHVQLLQDEIHVAESTRRRMREGEKEGRLLMMEKGAGEIGRRKG